MHCSCAVILGTTGRIVSNDRLCTLQAGLKHSLSGFCKHLTWQILMTISSLVIVFRSFIMPSTCPKMSSVDSRDTQVSLYHTCTEAASGELTCFSWSLIGRLVHTSRCLGNTEHLVMFSRRLDLPALLPPITITLGSSKFRSTSGHMEFTPCTADWKRPKELWCNCLKMLSPSNRGEVFLTYACLNLDMATWTCMHGGWRACEQPVRIFQRPCAHALLNTLTATMTE